jgi:hypothetical protein
MNTVRTEGNYSTGGENETHDDTRTANPDKTVRPHARSSGPYLVDPEAILHESATPSLRQPVALAAPVTVEFEYFGSGALKALGHRTGRRYCFGGPGARVAVDVRDRPALATVASLREV